jgi:GNAT superfamily N-acetyltransferase
MRVKIRKALLSDIPQIRALEEMVWKQTPATEEMLVSRIKTCPEGNVVAVVRDADMHRIAGYFCIIFIDYNVEEPTKKSWLEITDNGICAKTHSKNNLFGFGVTMTVDERYQNIGIGARLMIYGWDFAFCRNNKKGGIAISRIPKYHKYKHELTVEEYLNLKLDDGRVLDPEIRFYLREGYKVISIIPDYIEDEESCNYGVAMLIKNPFYNYPSFIRYPIGFLIKMIGPRALGL